MKRLIVAAAAFTLLGGTSAFAADAVVYNDAAPVAPDAVFSWTGGYIGVNLGYGGGDAKHPFSVKALDTNQGALIDAPGSRTIAKGSLNMTSSGFLGGVQAGWNFQSDRVVYGVEADFQGSDVKGETNFSLNYEGDTAKGKIGTKLNWFGTVRARLGYAATDRFLVYATGGLAYGETKSYVRASVPSEDISFSESAKKTKAGWTIGAGAEYAFADHWTLKSEYLYTDLGKANLYSDEIFEGVKAKLDRKFDFHTVRIGLNYKF